MKKIKIGKITVSEIFRTNEETKTQLSRRTNEPNIGINANVYQVKTTE